MKNPLASTLGVAAATLLLIVPACSSDSEPLRKVGGAEAVDIIEAGEHSVIDVRTPAEFAAGHVEGARNIDVSATGFDKRVRELDRDEEYIVYCQSGKRSASAAAKMVDLGFAVVVDAGGVGDLAAAGAGIVTGD